MTSRLDQRTASFVGGQNGCDGDLRLAEHFDSRPLNHFGILSILPTSQDSRLLRKTLGCREAAGVGSAGADWCRASTHHATDSAFRSVLAQMWD